jgi:hypothetical protein
MDMPNPLKAYPIAKTGKGGAEAWRAYPTSCKAAPSTMTLERLGTWTNVSSSYVYLPEAKLVGQPDVHYRTGDKSLQNNEPNASQDIITILTMQEDTKINETIVNPTCAPVSNVMGALARFVMLT